MVRPRWHDALIVSAIVAVLAIGVWALWWDDVRDLLHLGPDKGTEGGSAVERPVTVIPQT